MFFGVATPVAVTARAAPRVVTHPAFPPLPPIAYLAPALVLVLVLVLGMPWGCTDAPAVVANILYRSPSTVRDEFVMSGDG